MEQVDSFQQVATLWNMAEHANLEALYFMAQKASPEHAGAPVSPPFISAIQQVLRVSGVGREAGLLSNFLPYPG